MLFKKEVVLSEGEMALENLLEARAELERAKQMFNYAEDKYFEIANTELTVAELKYDVAFKKLKMLCADGIAVPQMQSYKSYICN